MSSRLKTAADAIVSALNAHTFSARFTAVRSILPEEYLKNLGNDLRVLVVSRDISETALAARSYMQEQISTDIAMFKRLPNYTTEQIDDLLELTDEIREHLLSLSVRKALGITKIEQSTPYSPDHLRESQLFIGVMTVTQEVIVPCSA